jgi:F-type H+-transporting ATPase subunit c
MPVLGLIAIGAGLAVLAGGAAALGMGLATSRSAEAIARQPEAAGKINSSLMFGLIMMETTAVYALLVAILLIFVLGGNAA